MRFTDLKPGAEGEKMPGYLLWKVSKLWQRHLNAALHDLALSSTQAVILIDIPRLGQERKTVTQMLLSQSTKIDRMTISQSIRSLEDKKFITRASAPHNKRAYQIKLTKRGKDVVIEAAKKIIATHQKFFKPLGPNTAAYVAYTQGLIKANNIEEIIHD